MRTLSHNQEIRVAGFSKLAQKVKVGTARGYAAEYGKDPAEAHQRELSLGYDTAWTVQSPGVLTADYPGKAEELRKAREAREEAPEIAHGEHVEIEGETFEVRVIGERYSDPVHFIRL